MSAWLDNQQNQTSSLRKLLQERMDKHNLRRKLTTEETQRLAKLETIADKLQLEKTCKTLSSKVGLVKMSTPR